MTRNNCYFCGNLSYGNGLSGNIVDMFSRSEQVHPCYGDKDDAGT